MTDKEAMLSALEKARQASDDEEVPVGAVVIRDGRIIGEGRNRREKGKNAVLHAEIEAIEQACERVGSWRLHGCELFVTLEPCPMCAGAIVNARLDRVVFGAYDESGGAVISKTELFADFGYSPDVVGGYMEKECTEVLTGFFKKRREVETAK